jgi:transposase
LYDLLKPHVTELVVCDPRKNASMREGNQSDKIDARRLAELLRLNHLSPVYHGEHGLRSLKELVRSYLTITKDLGRVMSRVKAIYRSWAIPCTGKQVYAPRHRAEWLGKIGEPGVRRRAEFYYQQLDALRTVRQEVRRELLAEGKKHQAWKRLCQIPSIGPIRSAVLLGILQTPHRFRTKRQLWTYSGFGIETQSSDSPSPARGTAPQSRSNAGGLAEVSPACQRWLRYIEDSRAVGAAHASHPPHFVGKSASARSGKERARACPAR